MCQINPSYAHMNMNVTQLYYVTFAIIGVSLGMSGFEGINGIYSIDNNALIDNHYHLGGYIPPLKDIKF